LRSGLPVKRSGARSLIYFGASMYPAFRDGDEVFFQPAGILRRGDVVVFTPPGENRNIVHRISRVEAHGIRTRGDGSGFEDPWVLRPEKVTGKAVFCRRGERIFRVRNGWTGGILAFIPTVAGIPRRALVRAVSFLIGAAVRPGTFSGFLPASCRPRILEYRRPEGIELLLTVSGRVLGRKPPGSSWTIRKRARLFIDPQKLP